MFITLTKKSPFYQLVHYIDGKRKIISTKTKSRKEAYRFLSEFQHQLEQPVEKIRDIRLFDFRDEYLSYVHQTKSKHYKRSVILSFSQLSTLVGNILLKDISTRMIDTFISQVYSRSPFSARLYYATLKAACSKAVQWNYLNQNPFKKIKTPKVPRSFPIFITENDLMEILNKTNSNLMKDIFTTGFYTGMRLSELLNMRWTWIDFNQSTITIKNSNEFKSKSKRERIIPIHPKVKDILQIHFPFGKRTANNKLVFYRYDGIKLNEDFVSKQFKKAARDAELNDYVHFHSLRHSFASALIQRGVSLYAVKELLGHEDIKTTQIYSHLQKDNLSEAVNLL